jgi:hypothetical protein
VEALEKETKRENSNLRDFVTSPQEARELVAQHVLVAQKHWSQWSSKDEGYMLHRSFWSLLGVGLIITLVDAKSPICLRASILHNTMSFSLPRHHEWVKSRSYRAFVGYNQKLKSIVFVQSLDTPTHRAVFSKVGGKLFENVDKYMRKFDVKKEPHIVEQPPRCQFDDIGVCFRNKSRRWFDALATANAARAPALTPLLDITDVPPSIVQAAASTKATTSRSTSALSRSPAAGPSRSARVVDVLGASSSPAARPSSSFKGKGKARADIVEDDEDQELV